MLKLLTEIGKTNIYIVRVFDTRQHPNKNKINKYRHTCTCTCMNSKLRIFKNCIIITDIYIT